MAVSTRSRSLAGDVSLALSQASDARFLGVMATALALTLGLLVALAFVLAFALGFLPAEVALPLVGEVSTPVGWIQGLAVGGLVIASAFLMIPVSAAFVTLFVDKVVVAVEDRHYPDRRGHSRRGMGEEIVEAARLMGLVILVNLAALVLYPFLGPLAPIVFYALNGYLLGREYFETVATHYMPQTEARALRLRYRTTAWAGGVLMAVPLTIPIMNLVIPVIGTAAFTHMVQRLRPR